VESRVHRDARGANVVVVPDNDKPAGSPRLVTAELHGVAKELRVVRVPKPHKDVTDWFSAGGTTEDLKALVLTTPLWTPELLPPPPDPEEEAPVAAADAPPPPPPAQGDAVADFHLTDIGNAERLIKRHGRDLRFVPAWRAWMEWDSKRWQRDETHAAERRAKETIRAIFEQLKHASPSKKEELYKHAMRSEGDARVRAMLNRAMAEPGVSITTRDLDADPWLLTVANGTLDLRTAELREHVREDLITKLVAVDWDPEAKCDRWEAFLNRIMGGNTALIAWLQRAVGYSLTGMTTEQCFFLLHGVGANGKTTFLEILRAIAGEYAAQTDFTTFTEKKSDGPRNDVARLFSARVVTSSEVGEGKRFNESLMKSLAGSEMISARFLYAELFDFMPSFKVFLAANHKPVIRGTDEGIWRRVRLIPFTVQIPPDEQDKDLLAKLRDELPGILAWAVAGCLLWQREGGLGIPEEVRAATAAYRTDSDTLGAFLEEYCERGDGYSETTQNLYAAYSQWAKDGGEFKMTQTTFSRRLEERGIGAEKRGTGANRKMWRLGVKLVVWPRQEGGRREERAPADDTPRPADEGNERDAEDAEARFL
jgi:putative DNA primase/helicase